MEILTVASDLLGTATGLIGSLGDSATGLFNGLLGSVGGGLGG